MIADQSVEASVVTDGPAGIPRILLIGGAGEDRSGIANRLSEGLDSAAYRLEIVAQADEGLERIKAGGCDLVLVCQGEVADQSLSALAAGHLGVAPPPIDLLVETDKDNVGSRALAMGAADYLLLADLSPGLLRQVLRSVLDRHQLAHLRDARPTNATWLFADHPLPMWIYDSGSLRILEVNEATCAQYGYSREEMLSLSILDLRPPEEQEGLLAFLRQSEESEAVAQNRSTGVWHHLRKDGSPLEVEIIHSRIVWNGRRARLVTGIDVSRWVRAEESARQSEQTLQTVFADLSDAVLVLDAEHRVVYANPAASHVFALDPEDLLELTVDPEQLLVGPERDELVDAEGHTHFVSMRVSPSTWNTRQVTIVSLRDVTDRRKAEGQLRLLRRSLEATGQGVVISDANAPDMPLIYANPAFERISGYRLSELLGRNCRFLQAGDRDQPELQTIRNALASQQHCDVVLRNYRRDGVMFWNRLTLAPVRDEQGKVSHYVGLVSDISEQKQLEAERDFLATHDAVTGLPRYSGNQHRFDELLREAVARKRELAVLFVDIDRFHTVNDTLGYQMGDLAIRRVADRLSGLPHKTALVVQHAGDEFLVLVGDLDPGSNLQQLGDEVCRCIAEPLVLSANATLHLTASVGIAGYSEGGGLTSMQELVRQSETAANRAKQQGRNCAYLFSSELRELLSDRLALGGRLRQAIARQEFLLHYQPQVDATDGAIVSVEALVRWNSPEFGLLHPRRFVPVAEDSGLIVSLGLHIVEMACRQARAWQDLGIRDLVVSINVSVAQIQRPAFIEEVQRVIGEVGVDPRMLEFEITESIVMDHAERAVGQLQRLKSLGISLALDDFGMGHSSLGYLRTFPIDKLKIDQSFIQDVATHSGDAALVRAMISMGHHLGMKVVAEGVENAAQCGYLRRAHCDQLQGYFFSEPVSGDAVPALVQRRYLRPLEAPSDQSERVLLLLDDEDNILRSLVRLLRRDGYRILTATSAAEAFDLLATNRVQVILSDQRMPAMSGTEFLSQVKVMYPHTVRIVLSGFTDLASVTDAINRGAIYKFLTKPWNDDELRLQVQEAFRMVEQQQEALP